MVDKKARSPDLETLKLQPVSARLPTESRNVVARKALVRRIQSEFEEMPGLSLTLVQASRLFGVAQDACARIFIELAKDGRLRHTAKRRYVREWQDGE
jgi:hypothetical protein